MNSTDNYLQIKKASENLRKAAEEYTDACGYENLKGGQIFHNINDVVSIHMIRDGGKKPMKQEQIFCDFFCNDETCGKECTWKMVSCDVTCLYSPVEELKKEGMFCEFWVGDEE